MNYRYLKISITVIIFSLIFTAFVACQTSPENDTVLTGKITSIYEDRIALDIITGSELVSDKTTLTINSDTKFENDLPKEYEVGDILTFTITGNVLESYPTQTTAERIISFEHDSEIVLD
ncbi:MAG: hypothetical protein JXQ23_09265 [Clostridia bacterium]|nr:hypothetical protein [Clostridia bacterium]